MTAVPSPEAFPTVEQLVAFVAANGPQRLRRRLERMESARRRLARQRDRELRSGSPQQGDAFDNAAKILAGYGEAIRRMRAALGEVKA